MTQNQEFTDKALQLLRHELGSINLSDINRDEVLSKAEEAEYDAAIAAVWPRIKKDMEAALHGQLMLTFTTADNMDKITLGQGTFNGISLLYQHWERAYNRHRAKASGNADKPIDTHSPIGEVEQRSA